jgi:hypothetical protein
MIKLKITPEQIKNLLSEHHVTQTKAAELCHVNPRTFRRWIAGDIPMPLAAWELLQIRLARYGQGVDFGFGSLEIEGSRYALLEQACESNDQDGVCFSARAIDLNGSEYLLSWRSSASIISVNLIQSITDKLDEVSGNYGLLKWGGLVAADDILRAIILIA